MIIFIDFHRLENLNVKTYLCNGKTKKKNNHHTRYKYTAER